MYSLWPTQRSLYDHSLSRGLKAFESSCLTRQRCDITLISNNLCEKKTSIRGQQLQWGTKAVLDKALLSWLAVRGERCVAVLRGFTQALSSNDSQLAHTCTCV